MSKEGLDKVLKEKVEPILDESLHKVIGITIPEFGKDITDKIEKSPLISYFIDANLPYKEAKKFFKKQFFERMLQTHLGNISAVAKAAAMDRRSVHRTIRELRIGIKGIRKDMIKADYYRKEAVEEILKSTLDSYKKIIRPGKLEAMYENVDQLSDEIVSELPAIDMTWDDAEVIFEKEYFAKVLKENKDNVSMTARKIGIRYESLHRKLKKLGLR